MSLKLSDLKEAKYNPRVISSKRLENLAKSIIQYGDLSGVVFNKRTNTLISGHQRLKTLREAGIKTKIITKKVKDKHGTIEEGFIHASTEHGEIRLPLRVVDWTDKKSEMAANIAANAHGGDFDRAKLGAILAKLEPGKKFDIDLIGLDPLAIRTLLPAVGGKDKDTGEDTGGSFQEFDEGSFEFQHVCPKCKFQFNDSAASKVKVSKDDKKSKKIESEAKSKKSSKAKPKKVEGKSVKKTKKLDKVKKLKRKEK